MKKCFIRKLTAFFLALLMLTSAFTTVAAENNDTSFSDVKTNAWYYKAVTYVSEKGLMVGTSDNVFSPNVKFTRAMTVQVLSQLSGDDLSGYTSTDFPDVPKGKWFTTAVAWAVDKGIAVGDGKNFNPAASVTREQLARMIHQFAVKYEISNKFPAGPENADGFADSAKISSWAKEGIEWAVFNGLLSGVGNNKLDPKGTATRAQAAQVFYYLHYMKTEGIIPPDTTDFDAITVTETDELRFICWGDSMTAGYPAHLQEISGIRAINYSSGGEAAEYIAMKQGGIPFYAAPFTIPASKDAVKIELLDDNYNTILGMAHLGNRGLTPSYIAGVKGNLFRNQADGCYYFSRTDSAPYEEVEVNRITRIVTKGMNDQRSNDFHIIFSGPSNGYSSDEAYKLIETQQKMIDYIGTDNYIIISLTSLYYLPNIWEFNEDLAEYYGEHFLDFRTYAIEHGLEDAGITPTEQDLADIAIGEIPSSLRSDKEHGNDAFDKLLAQQIYKKLIELGYLEAAAQ